MKILSWRLRGLLGALSLIVIGGFLGLMTDRFVLAHGRPAQGSIVAVGQTETVSAHDVAIVAFRDVLELDRDQASAIHEILSRRQSLVDEAWENLRALLQDEVHSAHSEIRAVLTPAQQARFEDWVERHVRYDPNGDPAFRWAH